MFYKYILDYNNNVFEELQNTIQYEDIINGRKGTNIIDYKNNLIPLVRTTTIYNKPAQPFLDIHYNIINDIKRVSNIENIEFNNALIEIYEPSYHKMKFHTDQSLDLVDDSYICLFSCYKTPNCKNKRKLIIQNKITKELSEIILEHNSIVIFSTKTNQEYVHKIILENVQETSLWLGITFRLSKTYIHFIDNTPYFYLTNIPLRISTNEERREFAKHKGMENQFINYKYPEIYYTISIGDIMNIKS